MCCSLYRDLFAFEVENQIRRGHTFDPEKARANRQR
jgi:hypothetical protein